MKSQPPRWASKLINWLAGDGRHADISGDLYEEYILNVKERGVKRARFIYILTVLMSLRPYLLRQKLNFNLGNVAMLSNYWIVTKRFVLKNKTYAGVNIFGLAIGIASSIVLLIYVSNELSYDRFHEEGDRIYRLSVTTHSPEGISSSPIITAAIAPSVKDELPEVENFVRLSYPTDGFLSVGSKKVNIQDLLYVDSTFFSMFSFDLLAGSSNTSLSAPYSVVLTDELAKSIFGNYDPIGKTVNLNGEDPLIVTGVVRRPPSNSQIQFSCLISFSTLEKKGYYLDWNGGWNYFEYIKLVKDTDLPSLKSKFSTLMDTHINTLMKEYEEEWVLGIEPLLDIHLSEQEGGDWPNRGSMIMIYIFSTVAILILFMASVNFINLTISQSMNRLKEIGVRKSIGATKKMLVSQFIFESFLYTVVSLGLAFLLLFIFYNTINEFLGYQLDQIYLNNIVLSLVTVGFVLAISIGSGAYPAFYLAALSPSRSIKGSAGVTTKPQKVDVLVVFQFFISLVLISSTWIIYDQIQFVQTRDLGYAKENIITVKLTTKQASKNLEILKSELSKIPEIISAGASSALPGNGFTSNGYVPEGKSLPVMLHVLDIDNSYLSTMGMEVVSGRNFTGSQGPDRSVLLVNEALVKEMAWQDPLGKTIERDGKHKVIGVVKDFNYASLHDKIEPMVFTNAPWRDQFNHISIRIRPTDLTATIEKIENTWREVNDSDPFEFKFLDQEFNSLYYKEQQQAKLLFFFSVLAILIGGMGLFGLVSYSLVQRTKEIGVRKVLGATSFSLILGVSKKYVWSILLASLFAVPLVLLMMGKWRSTFYYRIDLSPSIFLLSILIVLLIVLVIINIHTLKAIRKNPSESLKYE